MGGNAHVIVTPTMAPRRIKTLKSFKFFFIQTRQRYKSCVQHLFFTFLNCAFSAVDRAMYILGPILILLASGIIVGLTYVFFRIVLLMLAGTNWVTTKGDWQIYWIQRGYRISIGSEEKDVLLSPFQSILLALSTPAGVSHTIVVAFFLFNINYNYYKCVTTSNTGPNYDLVVRELAAVTGFQYPETEEDLVQCKNDLERLLLEKINKRRKELMEIRNSETIPNASVTSASDGANCSLNRNGESQVPQPTSSLFEPSTGERTSSITHAPCGNDSKSSTSSQKTGTNVTPTIPKLHNWQLLSPNEWSYCRYSKQPKPPRSHYDHVTKSLVLNMDHFCPWMFNVIGYFNYRYFFNFLWFATIALFYGACLCLPAFRNMSGKLYRDQVRASGGLTKPLKEISVRHFPSNAYIPTPNERSAVAFGFMLCLSVGIAVLCLGCFHLYLVLSAQTTIEFHANISKRKKVGWRNPYSTGSWKQNWEMVYGTRQYHRDTEKRHSDYFCFISAMLPSSREPEFLPIPIDGRPVKRKLHDHIHQMSDERTDLELGITAETLNGLNVSLNLKES